MRERERVIYPPYARQARRELRQGNVPGTLPPIPLSRIPLATGLSCAAARLESVFLLFVEFPLKYGIVPL